jgi:type IV pilus assembly protein PilC
MALGNAGRLEARPWRDRINASHQSRDSLMLFFSSSISGLVQWCRSLKHLLGAGVSLTRAFELQVKKGPRPLRDMAERIAARLQKGDSLEDALEEQGERLPKLFRDLAAVGERTGHLPDVFSDLSDYYELQQSLGREFRSQITMPVLQFFAAVGVIGLLIWILGIIADERGGDPIAPIGFGLTGASGAITFFAVVGCFLGLIAGLYFFVTRSLKKRGSFEAFLLRLPVAGPCVQAFAMGRFCLALRLTLETGMPTPDALRQSLRAAGNAAFTAYEDRIAAMIKAGREIHAALRVCPAFPEEFLDIVELGEHSGQIPEMMIRQSAHYCEEASSRLRILTRVASRGVYVFVSILIIFAIFRIASIYIDALGVNSL